MKTALLTIALVFFISSAPALDLNSLKDKAQEAVEASPGLKDLSMETVRDQLEKVFDSAKPELKGQVLEAVTHFAENQDSGFFKNLAKVKNFKLTEEQKSVWNRVKSDLTAAVVERNFTFEEVRASEAVQNVVGAVKQLDLEAAKESIADLREVAELSEKQKSLLKQVEKHAGPVKDKILGGLGW